MPTLDTSLLVDLIRHDPEAMRTLEAMEQEGLPFATTVINILELYRGACLSASAQENIREVEAIIRALIELPITDETCRIFGALAAELRGNGKPIGDFDEVIAAITLAGDGELVIRDHHFARVPGLKDQDVLRSRAGGVVRGPRNPAIVRRPISDTGCDHGAFMGNDTGAAQVCPKSSSKT